MTEKKKSQKIKGLEFFTSATFVGIVTSLVVVYFAFSYYKKRNNLEAQDLRNDFIYNITETINQKTLDWRFQLRGPRIPKEKVAVLAIDDDSLNQIGRWPWDRDKMGELIDRLMSQGAKALGFDIVFSEPQVDSTYRALSEIESKFTLGSEIKAEFERRKKSAQPDQKLADIINKHRDRLILGAFYEEAENHYEPYQDVCYTEAIKRTPNSKIMETEELPLFFFNDYETKAQGGNQFAQVSFTEYFNPVFTKIEQGISENYIKNVFNKNNAEELSKAEYRQLEFEKIRSTLDYCATWLTDKYDTELPYWKDVWAKMLEPAGPIAKLPFDQGVVLFQNYFRLNPILQKGRWTTNIPELVTASAHNAFFNAVLDSDGVLRRSPLVYRSGFNYVPSLALQTYLVASNHQAHFSIDLDTEDTAQLRVSRFDIKDPEKDEPNNIVTTPPVDSRSRLIVNYAGPQMSYPHLSATELFHDRPTIKYKQRSFNKEINHYEVKEFEVPRQDFIKDRTFIVGATAIGVYDLRVTPFEENYPGVETHANVLGNLFSQNFLRAPPQEFTYMMATLVLLGLTLAFSLNHLGAIAGLLISAFIVIAIYVIDRFFLFKNGLVVATAFPAILVGANYVIITFYKYLTEERKKKYLKSTFSKYVSPAIVDEILKDPENVQLGGKKQRMSVFFSDLRGFTTISEKLDPQVLVQVLNEYLTPMTNIVFQNKGTLDKYMGDAVMAFFGAPIFYEDHAKYACRCALQSIVKLKELQKDFEKRGLPYIDLGIGINSADMSVGNMGSDIVRNYTVMGDAVNLGSRLEGTNKEYGTRIIISEFTYEDVKGAFTTRELDWVRVKGKLQPIKIFELISEGPPSAETQLLLKHYNEGYALYRSRKFQEALTAFEAALAASPSDPVSQLYVSRCQDYLEEPPPESWDGVYIMKTK